MGRVGDLGQETVALDGHAADLAELADHHDDRDAGQYPTRTGSDSRSARKPSRARPPCAMPGSRELRLVERARITAPIRRAHRNTWGRPDCKHVRELVCIPRRQYAKVGPASDLTDCVPAEHPLSVGAWLLYPEWVKSPAT